ncbi:hypothetical protein [Methylocystis parvus]|uniref:hypothetical protein n=1 Tax=Methylocystis parvus TaxID=134 RepID=UPI003C76B1DB
MRTGIERIVQPFQRPDYAPPRLTTGAALTKSNGLIRHEWGGNAQGALLTATYQSQTQFYVKHKQKEETA